MATYVMFGRYTAQALQQMSSGRTAKAVALIKQLGGHVESMHATLGDHDLVLILSFPDASQAIKASVALTKLTGIAFSTSEAVPVEEFDRLVSEL